MANPQVEKGHIRIANDLYEALYGFDFTQNELKIVLYVIRQTYGFKRKFAVITQAETGLKLNINKSRASNAFKTLFQMKILSKNESGEIGLNKDFDAWQKLLKKQPKVAEKATPKVAKKATISCRKSNSELLKKQPKVAEKATYTQYIAVKTNFKENSKENIKEIEASKQPLANPKTPQAEVFEMFKEIYETKTLQPFNSEKKDFIILCDLVKKHGIDAVKTKVVILAQGCEHNVFWFAKGGFSDFNIGTLSTHWNRLVPIETPEQRKERQEKERRLKFLKKLEEDKKQND